MVVNHVPGPDAAVSVLVASAIVYSCAPLSCAQRSCAARVCKRKGQRRKPRWNECRMQNAECRMQNAECGMAEQSPVAANQPSSVRSGMCPMPQRRSDMPLLTELEKVLVGPCHYKHAAPDGAIQRGWGYEILRLKAWNRRQQSTQKEAPPAGGLAEKLKARCSLATVRVWVNVDA